MPDKYDNKLHYIVGTYGIDGQLRHMMTEVYELIEAIITYRDFYKTDTTAHIAEEIADIRVFLRQLQLAYYITDKEIEDVMKFKIDRQIERMHNDPDIKEKYTEMYKSINELF